MEIENIDESNFLIYATKNYEPSQVFGVAELNQELGRFVWIKKLLMRYSRGEEINIRLLTNHFVVLGNIFNAYALNRMLFFYMNEEIWPQLYAILDFLNLINSNIPEADMSTLSRDEELYQKLKEM